MHPWMIFALSRFLQYLWGIETRTLSRPQGLFFPFLQYLWGIETQVDDTWNIRVCTVFTVPMRNWNVFSFSCIANSMACFYSTYEELKQLYLSAFNCGYYVFTVPMRNWNENLHWVRTELQLSFYSTYEELKLFCFCFCFLYSSQVFTVPMRNWNFEELVLHLSLLPVFTVPMRNWNCQFVSLFQSLNTGFYSTYEELKLRGLWTVK